MIEYKGFGLRIDRAGYKGLADPSLEGTDGPLHHTSPKYMLNGSRGLRRLVTPISNRQII
jgi:hypothetical protein